MISAHDPERLEMRADRKHLAIGHQFAFVIVRIHQPRERQLLLIVDAGYPSSMVFCFGKNRQQERRENRDDGNDDQEFDQREARAVD